MTALAYADLVAASENLCKAIEPCEVAALCTDGAPPFSAEEQLAIDITDLIWDVIDARKVA